MDKHILKLADRLHNIGRLEKAISLLESYLATFPKDLSVAELLNRFHQEQSPHKKATERPLENQASTLPKVGLENLALYGTAREPEEDLYIPVFEETSFAQQQKLNLPEASSSKLESIDSPQPDHYVEPVEPQPISIKDIWPDDYEDFDDLDDNKDFDIDEDPTSTDLKEENTEPDENEEQAEDYKADLYPEIPDWVGTSYLDAFDEDEPGLDEPLTLEAEQRAIQEATKIANNVGWGHSELPILKEILAHHKLHGKTKKALIKLILEQNASAEELAILHELRMYWMSSGYNRISGHTESREGWASLPWFEGLELLRGLKAGCAEEAMMFVDDCFEDWNNDTGLLVEFPVFALYLLRIIDIYSSPTFKKGYIPSLYFDHQLFLMLDDNRFSEWHRNGTSFPPELQLRNLMENEDFYP